MNERVELTETGELLSIVHGLRRYAAMARDLAYKHHAMPIHVAVNLVELARDAEDVLMRAEVVHDESGRKEYADYFESQWGREEQNG